MSKIDVTECQPAEIIKATEGLVGVVIRWCMVYGQLVIAKCRKLKPDGGTAAVA